MVKKKKQDLGLGAGLMAFGIFVMVTAKDYGPIEMVDYTISPSFVPFFLGLLIVFLSILLMVNAGLSIMKSSREQQEGGGESEKLEMKNVLTLGLAIALIFGYVLFLLPKLGFLLATIVFLALFMYLLGVRSPVKLVLISVIGSGVFYLIFSMVFHIPLPVFTLF